MRQNGANHQGLKHLQEIQQHGVTIWSLEVGSPAGQEDTGVPISDVHPVERPCVCPMWLTRHKKLILGSRN